MRVSRAIERMVQCVPSLGLVSRVLRTKEPTLSSEIVRGRPGLNSSWSPCTP